MRPVHSLSQIMEYMLPILLLIPALVWRRSFGSDLPLWFRIQNLLFAYLFIHQGLIWAKWLGWSCLHPSSYNGVWTGFIAFRLLIVLVLALVSVWGIFIGVRMAWLKASAIREAAIYVPLLLIFEAIDYTNSVITHRRLLLEHRNFWLRQEFMECVWIGICVWIFLFVTSSKTRSVVAKAEVDRSLGGIYGTPA